MTSGWRPICRSRGSERAPDGVTNHVGSCASSLPVLLASFLKHLLPVVSGNAVGSASTTTAVALRGDAYDLATVGFRVGGQCSEVLQPGRSRVGFRIGARAAAAAPRITELN